MKLNRIHLFILITSAALCTVLAIQVNWIIRTAKVKEELFNEKANLVLSKTAEALSAGTSLSKPSTIYSETDRHRIDSLLNHFMELYDIRIAYTFDVAPMVVKSPSGLINSNYLSSSGTYQTCIGDAPPGEQAWELKLFFPHKRQFILAEMGIPFITSVLLILAVLLLSWRTILSLLKEKRIAEHTTDFLNNMTHAFKTPLTNIALAGRLLTKESALQQEEKIAYYSGIILDENEKLRMQVEEVLSMAALERGEIPLRKAPADLHQLVQDAVKHLRLSVENAGGEINLQLNAIRHMVMADKTHLVNAICNLLDNALRYSVQQPKISVTTADHGKEILLAVEDNGIGIEKEYQKKVFEKYFRVPTGDVHAVKGFGLGLTYVKKIITLHGGTIALQSEKGKGTRFTITLPHG